MRYNPFDIGSLRVSSSVEARHYGCVLSIIYINDIYSFSFLQLLIFFFFYISSSSLSPLLSVRVSCYFTVDLALGNYYAVVVRCQSRIILDVYKRQR